MGGKMKDQHSEQFSEICKKGYYFSIYCHQHSESKKLICHKVDPKAVVGLMSEEV